MARSNDDGEGPTGYVWYRGWSSSKPDSEGLVSVGGIMVPAAFEIHAMRPDGVGGYTFSAVLAYELQDGELRLHGIQSDTHDLVDALRILRRDNSWDEWKRLARVLLYADEATRAGGTFEDIGRAVRTAHGSPVRRTRTRVTASTLEDVAKVYRAAWESGHPPTVAVAKHFHKSHSTAARWVSLARERGYLGKADGTRAGEASAPNGEVERMS